MRFAKCGLGSLTSLHTKPVAFSLLNIYHVSNKRRILSTVGIQMVSLCVFNCFVLLLPGASETSNPSITPSTNVAAGNGTSGGSAGGSSPGAKDQLMYLAHLLGFTVQFSDFPKVYYNKLYECMSRGLSSLRMSILPPSPLWMCKSRLWDCRDGQHPTYPAW